MTLPLIAEVPPELDLHLELDDDLTLFLTPGALQLIGLRSGVPLAIDPHPLSLRLEALTGPCPLETPGLPLAHLDIDGYLRLPLPPPLLTSRRVVLQIRDRGLRRELHLVAESPE